VTVGGEHLQQTNLAHLGEGEEEAAAGQGEEEDNLAPVFLAAQWLSLAAVRRPAVAVQASKLLVLEEDVLEVPLEGLLQPGAAVVAHLPQEEGEEFRRPLRVPPHQLLASGEVEGEDGVQQQGRLQLLEAAHLATAREREDFMTMKMPSTEENTMIY
jgi:hypothetical protein